jgi:hypothetical protein
MEHNDAELPRCERTNGEVRKKKIRAIVCVAVALGTFFGGLLSAAVARPAPAGAVACYFVARGYINPNNGTSITYGYFTVISGIPGPLFSGAPSENTAFFTIRTDVLQGTMLPTNGDVGIILWAPSSVSIYFNPAPAGDWSDPDTFSSGILIGRYQLPEQEFLQLPAFTRAVGTPTLTSSRNFSFNGNTYNLRSLLPAWTYDDTISNAPVPGISGFPDGIAYGGDCLAVASTGQD